MRGRLGGLSANALGSLYMVVGSLGYVVNDALIRAATDEGLDVYQAVFFRGVAMAVLFGAVASVRNEQINRAQLQGPLLVRVAVETMATGLFFAGLVHLEFANAQTILLVVPFAVTIVAARFGETVTALQYATVLVGFVGVVAVMRPGTGAFSMVAGHRRQRGLSGGSGVRDPTDPGEYPGGPHRAAHGVVAVGADGHRVEFHGLG